MARASNKTQPLDRRRVVAAALDRRPDDLLVVTGLGSPTYDVAACGDNPRNFHLWGAMGLAVPMGLGLALARPSNRVLVVTGDGEMLMGMGSFGTVGIHQPDNLAVLVLDNEAYGETGGQFSHTARGVDLCAVASGCGFVATCLVRQSEDIDGLRDFLVGETGPVLAVAKIGREELQRVLPSRDGHYLRQRFRSALSASTS